MYDQFAAASGVTSNKRSVNDELHRLTGRHLRLIERFNRQISNEGSSRFVYKIHRLCNAPGSCSEYLLWDVLVGQFTTVYQSLRTVLKAHLLLDSTAC